MSASSQILRPQQLSLTVQKHNSYRKLVTFLLVLLVFPSLSFAKETKQHALSLIGTPRHDANFKHFDYVNPNAPKGGKVRLGTLGTFDNLNMFVYRGNLVDGIGLIYDSLMSNSLDEASTIYPNLAESVSVADDLSSASYTLRKEARWHDGKPITPEDVIFSFNTFKKIHPQYNQYYKNVKSIEKTGDRTVTFHFAVKNNKELPYIVGELTILPKHFWKGKKADGTPRDPSKTSLEIPLGSGAYKISKVNNGKSIVYERVKDYWAAKLPVNVGQHNIDYIGYDYFRDGTANFQAFKAGQLDYRAENMSKQWATGYNFPALKRGEVVKEEITLKNLQPMQSFAMNIRRKKFSDPRVRHAFSLAFDFEWANKNLFYSQYKRTSSFFQNSELAATGLPKGQELALLEELKGSVPKEVFTTPYTPPTNNSPKDLRAHLIKAKNLLKEAGWKISKEIDKSSTCGFLCKIGLSSQSKKKVLRNKDGKLFKVEFLLVSPAFKRIVLPYMKNLKKLGITASIRLIDLAQYKRHLDKFDYDIIIASWGQSLSPGNEQRNYWGSTSANRSGSRNFVGIKNPAIDKLIDKIIFAKDRASLVAATRALDRVLLWNHYAVPQWHSPNERIAYWKRFSRPSKMPSRSVGFPTIWWYDEAKAASMTKK